MDRVSGKLALSLCCYHGGSTFPSVLHIPSIIPTLFASPREQKRSHTLRYVLKNRATDKVLFVVLFTLYLKEDVNEDGTLKEGIEGGKPLALLDEKEKQRHE